MFSRSASNDDLYIAMNAIKNPGLKLKLWPSDLQT